MAQRFYGSIDVTEITNQANARHSSFSKGKNGKIYASVNVWVNDEPDKYGNYLSIQLNPTKEMAKEEKKVYIGNLKKGESSNTPLGENDRVSINTDIPSHEDRPVVHPDPVNITPIDESDLPF